MNHDVISQGEPPREGLRDRVLVLRSSEMFQGLDDDGLILLAEHARTALYRKGDFITVEGEAPRAMHLLVEGQVSVSRGGEHVGVLKAGDTFGGLALIARVPSGLAVCTADTRTLEVPGAAFEIALDENYSLLRNALRVTGALALEARGNLPVDPRAVREIDEGTYYAEPRSMVERLIQLRAGPFGYMNLDALVDLARHLFEVRFPAGHVLWSAGDPSTHSLHIDCGRVRCTAPDGRHVEVGRDFTLGVLDVWGAQRRAYSARTETPVIGFRVDFESFLTLLESHVEVGIDILRGFALALLEVRGMATPPVVAPAGEE